MQTMNTLATNLALAMSKSELYSTQEQLAEALGVSQTAIQKVLSGQTKQPRYIVEMATLLNVSPQQLTSNNNKNLYKKNVISNIYDPIKEPATIKYDSHTEPSTTQEKKKLIELYEKIDPKNRQQAMQILAIFASKNS